MERVAGVVVFVESMAACDVTEGQHVQNEQQGTKQRSLGDTMAMVYHLQLYIKI